MSDNKDSFPVPTEIKTASKPSYHFLGLEIKNNMVVLVCTYDMEDLVFFRAVTGTSESIRERDAKAYSPLPVKNSFTLNPFKDDDKPILSQLQKVINQLGIEIYYSYPNSSTSKKKDIKTTSISYRYKELGKLVERVHDFKMKSKFTEINSVCSQFIQKEGQNDYEDSSRVLNNVEPIEHEEYQNYDIPDTIPEQYENEENNQINNENNSLLYPSTMNIKIEITSNQDLIDLQNKLLGLNILESTLTIPNILTNNFD